jgi:hypothetical protein
MLISRKLGLFAAAGLIATGLATTACLADSGQQAPITVTVDSHPIDFNGTQPMETSGSVLVPLRGVFEALHANVDYDPSNQTITANRGSRNVVVTIGSNRAVIDGQSEHISQPAEIVNGSTMVPLRFVAEALGDYVQWSGATNTVSIVRQNSNDNMAANPNQGNSEAAPQQGNSIVVGRFQRASSGMDNARIEIRSDGRESWIPLTHDVVISRGRNRDNAAIVSLSDLQPGDRVVVHENDSGRATNITAMYGQRGM